ncbi:aminoglycoside phosphotransferase family protein [Actinokineospora auranticolor]|uniref:Streptomycin 6-kinase/streptomycin 6-kinase n=1 Tax=Actinokineospora auranticolor TaxID=155976 RepID=A0A2S6GCT9_9PSEU|nr:aminoglycoside phosphotransferase family protein [Actinokineospora auranticolor]PPK62759.1 streptomycin 6-kinase/streptomycin 6-kinase [Actinokineospora auranticolor]
MLLPEVLLASYRREGEAGRAWIAALPTLVEESLARWDLVPDGVPGSGEASLVLPVRATDGGRAVLKFQPPRDESRAAVVGLRAWDGAGIVRLIDHDPASTTMLLERLDGSRSLADVGDDDTAMGVLAELMRGLTAVPAPAGLRGLADIATAMLDEVPAALRSLADPDERRLLRSCADAVTDLVDEPGDRLLHWDLHYGNVLAGEREPWLAIDPEPLAGDPGFDLMPALDSEWDAVVAAGAPTRTVDRRFDLLTDALDLDRSRAAGWTLGRVLQNSLWDIEDGRTALAPGQIIVARAMLAR